MQITWNAVERVVTTFARLHFEDSQLQTYAFRDYVYRLYRNGCVRTVGADQERGLLAAEAAWPAEAARRLGERYDRGEVGRELQVQRGGVNVWIEPPEQPRRDDRVVAIVHRCQAGDSVARLQAVVGAGASGIALEQRLAPWLSQRSAVGDWKVMGPRMGAEGPDSVVVYLVRPLQDAATQRLIVDLAHVLRADLDDLASPPLGLQRLAAGIYGLDVPPRNVQRDNLAMTEYDSAGSIIASVLCKAAHLAFIRADVAPVDPRRMRFAEFAAYCRQCLESVAAELGWTVA